MGCTKWSHSPIRTAFLCYTLYGEDVGSVIQARVEYVLEHNGLALVYLPGRDAEPVNNKTVHVPSEQTVRGQIAEHPEFGILRFGVRDRLYDFYCLRPSP